MSGSYPEDPVQIRYPQPIEVYSRVGIDPVVPLGSLNTNKGQVLPVVDPSESVGYMVVKWAGRRKMDSPLRINNRNARTGQR
jgi:hypothetical protein